MKKFIIITIVIVVVAAGAIYANERLGWRLPADEPEPSEIQVLFSQEGTTIYKNTPSKEPYEIKGVDLGAAQPGNFATDYAISKETYLRWFQMIKDLGANCIRNYILNGPAFYEAFYEFNENNPNPLYLVHGVWVDDYANNSHLSAHDPEFKDAFKDDVRTMIDVIHGNRVVELGRVAGTGSYTHDISPWVIGYILGVEWEPNTVVYTDLIDDEKTSYQGEYLYTVAEATPFEAMLAEVGDEALNYETQRYHEQKLIAFSNWPHTDPLEYPEIVSEKLTKYVTVDVEHIKETSKVLSGMFASYHIYPYYPDYYRYVPGFDDKTDSSGSVNTYYAYLSEIARHHTIPVVISEFGVSTSRGRSANDTNTARHQGLMTEQQQGLAIIQCYQDIKDAGCAGCFLFIWQDEWFKRSWNTWAYTDTLENPYWSNAQTPEQAYGLLTFDPGDERSVSYVDGDLEEWTSEDVVSENDGMTLSMKYDLKYVYLLVQGDDVDPEHPIFIPIDTTQKTGSKKVAGTDLSFDRDADFLLVLDGVDNSHLLVQERYEVIRATSWKRLIGVNSYVEVPEKDTDVFKPIYLVIESDPLKLENGQNIVDLIEGDSHIDSDILKQYDSVYETGKLTYGNANPESDEYNSVADFIYGMDSVEVRIPWELLNFSNPSQMQIHDDYYEEYGVENLSIDEMWVGVGNGKTEIPMDSLELQPWGHDVSYHERLKESYYLLQQVWNGDKTAQEVLEEAKAAGEDHGSATPIEILSYDDLYNPESDSKVAQDPTEAILDKALS